MVRSPRSFANERALLNIVVSFFIVVYPFWKLIYDVLYMFECCSPLSVLFSDDCLEHIFVAIFTRLETAAKFSGTKETRSRKKHRHPKQFTLVLGYEVGQNPKKSTILLGYEVRQK